MKNYMEVGREKSNQNQKGIQKFHQITILS
jgi:hypothetical protein